MAEVLCPFSSTLVSETFGCANAEQVVRRGGAEIACQDEQAWSRCNHVFTYLKQISLPEFEVEDDLTSMPHSVLQKIQFGGLLGLQTQLAGETGGIENIDGLLGAVLEKSGAIESIPTSGLVSSITSYKLKRRRGRG